MQRWGDAGDVRVGAEAVIAGIDSSIDRPNAAIIQQARAAGIRLWIGYLATNQAPGAFNLESPWDLASFDVARQLPCVPIGMCSGWDDPAAIRQLAAAWRVRPCLDCEDGIRADGPWVPGWLATSGAGLYGLSSVHDGRSAAFHILARYPCSPPACCDPGASWPEDLARPASPTGWQWCGTHTEFGISVDRGWYDEALGGIMDEATFKQWVRDVLNEGSAQGTTSWAGTEQDILGTIQEVFNQDSDAATKLQAIQAALGTGQAPVSFQPVLDAVAALGQKVDALGHHLGEGTA